MRRFATAVILLGMIIVTPSIVFAQSREGVFGIENVFHYGTAALQTSRQYETNVYLKYVFDVCKRNFTLALIPTMDEMAHSERKYIGESYSRLTFSPKEKPKIHRHVFAATTRHNRKVMPMVQEMLIPNLYSVTLFPEKILSPFNVQNRKYYAYQTIYESAGQYGLSFRPKVNNTQLVAGHAVIEKQTGKIISCNIAGEYDMVSFDIATTQGELSSPFPGKSEIKARFSFMGNDVSCRMDAFYNCARTLPDTCHDMKNRAMVELLRQEPLNEEERAIWAKYDETHNDSVDALNAIAEAFKKNSAIEEIGNAAWNILDDNFISSLGARNERASLQLSPILNPMYLSYGSKGISYKMRLEAIYNLNANSLLKLRPQVGFNFKKKYLYADIPFRYTFDKKSDGFVEMTYELGNRITNSAILEKLKSERRDTIDFDKLELDYFIDHSVTVMGHYRLGSTLTVEGGGVYHYRRALNRDAMRELGKQTEYNSFAPSLKLIMKPWHLGPTYTLSYERSIKDVLRSSIEYERIEADLSYKAAMSRLRTINVRMGFGLYTNRNTEYFVDYRNFREDNLPEGWNDDWTGNFQLLDSRWYNTSTYYVRSNVSFESPLLMLTWLPLFGKCIEQERIYASALLIEHTHPYLEFGYGFTNRYLSFATFCNALNVKVREVGCKVTLTLFSKW